MWTLYKIIEYNPDLKVILMTAYENLKCNKSRFIFLSESIPIARLLELINETLGRQSQTQQSSETIPNLKRKYNTLYNVRLVNTKLQYQYW